MRVERQRGMLAGGGRVMGVVEKGMLVVVTVHLRAACG